MPVEGQEQRSCRLEAMIKQPYPVLGARLGQWLRASYFTETSRKSKDNEWALRVSLAPDFLLYDRTPSPPPSAICFSFPQLFLGMLGTGITHKGSGISLFMFFPLEPLGPGVCVMPLQLVSWVRCHSHGPSGALDPKAAYSVWMRGEESGSQALVVVLCEVGLAQLFYQIIFITIFLL